MSTIRSTLIKTCVTNVQKELGQLEHWLNIIPDDNVNTYTNSTVNNRNNHINTYDNYSNDIASIKMSISNISNNINTLINTTNRQQTLIDSINTRLQHIENIRTIRVDDPWTDNHIVPLQNEIVNQTILHSDSETESDNESECIYCVNKQENDGNEDNVSNDSESVASVHPLLKTPELQPNIPDDMSDVPDINDDTCDNNLESVAIVHVDETKNTEQEEQKVEVEQQQQEEVEIEEEEEVEEEQQEEQVEVSQQNKTVEDTVKETEEQQQEAEQEEEEVAEEEEEEDLELEEIEFKDTKYYKDGEGFIYSINEDDEPSENPIGYWKEKTQSIAFYKLK